jgi:hypothetical protein
MNKQFTLAAVVLGAVLAAPSVVMAEDVISDEAIRLSTDQTVYNNAVAKRAARVQAVQSKSGSSGDFSRRQYDESFSANSR